MVQKTFGIYSESDSATDLFIEIGAKHVVCWTTDAEKAVAAFEFFQADNETKTHLKEIFKQTKLHSKVLDRSYNEITFVLDNDCCLLIPKMNLTEDQQNDLMRLAFGDTKQSTKKAVDGKVNYLYSVHHQLSELLQQFPSAHVQHKYETLTHDGISQDHSFHILLSCYPEHCIVTVRNAEQLVLMQRYTYETPDDVVYYVLNICKQLNAELSDVAVTIQGLVDTDSKLYAELHKYISNLQLHQPVDLKFTSDAFAEYPAHYFSSFINNRA